MITDSEGEGHVEIQKPLGIYLSGTSPLVPFVQGEWGFDSTPEILLATATKCITPPSANPRISHSTMMTASLHLPSVCLAIACTRSFLFKELIQGLL